MAGVRWFRRFARSGVAFVLLPLAMVGGVGAVAHGAELTQSCLGAALTAPDEVAALDLAAECGWPVEIESARGFTQRQLAEPDGTITLESYLWRGGRTTGTVDG